MTNLAITAGQPPFASGTVAYYRVESFGDRLRRLSNVAADVAGRAMAMGYEEAAFIEYAEMADEMWAIAEFFEPSASFVVTTSTIAADGSPASDGWVFNNGGEYGTSRC